MNNMFPYEKGTDAVDFNIESDIVKIGYYINNGAYQHVKNVSVDDTELQNATQ